MSTEGEAPTSAELDQLALRVAVKGVYAEDAKQAYERAQRAYGLAREEAAVRFAIARKDGLPQIAVVLPGGVEAGKLAVEAGATTVEVNEDELLLLVAAGTPSEIEDYATDAAEYDPRVVGLLAEHCPDLVELRTKDGALSDERAVKILAEHAPELVNARINRAERQRLQSWLEDNEGCVPDPATGKPVRVATITHHDPTGEFSWAGKTRNIGRVREALASGRLVVTEAGDVAEAAPAGDA